MNQLIPPSLRRAYQAQLAIRQLPIWMALLNHQVHHTVGPAASCAQLLMSVTQSCYMYDPPIAVLRAMTGCNARDAEAAD